MVLREIDKTVIAGAIKLLQLFNSKKLERIIDVLKEEDYNDHKKVYCQIRFDIPFDNESVTEEIAESPLPQLEQLHFELELSPYDFYFFGEICGLLNEEDSQIVAFHQHRLNHSEETGDLVEFTQYIQLALQIPQVRKHVEIKAPLPKNYKPISFEKFLRQVHELQVFEEERDLKSFEDYKNFEAETVAKRERHGLIDFKIIFREIFQDLVHEGEECSELEFNLIRGNPLALLEIGCNWSDFPPRQYQTATEVFTYIRSVTEKFYGLKKQTTKTSRK